MRKNDAILLCDRCPLRQVLEVLPIGVAVIEKDGSYSYINQTGQKILSIKNTGHIHKSSADKVNNDNSFQRNLLEQFPLASVLKGETVKIEDFKINTDVQAIALEIQALPIFAQNGEVAYAIVTFKDITQRKQAEIARQQSEEYLRTVVNNVPLILWATDKYGIFTLSEGKGLEGLGLKAGEAVGYSATDMYTYLPEVVSGFRATLTSGVPYHVTATANDCTLESLGNAFYDEEGNIQGMIGVSMDITQRQRAQDALLESEAKFRRLAENVPGTIFRYVLHPDGTAEFTYLSPRCRQIFEVEPKAGLRDANVLWAMVYAEDIPRVQQAIQSTQSSLETGLVEYRIVTPSHRLKWIEAMFCPARQANGDILWDGIFIDITQRKQTEQLLGNYNRTLEQQVRSRTQKLSLEIQERKRAEAQARAAEAALRKAYSELERVANLDGLTQVANRRRFDEYYSQKWVSLAQEEQPLSLILCDVDFFKRYNDYYGHIGGDACLRSVATAINRAAKRSLDLVARYGGEEFAVILPYTDASGVEKVAQDIRKEIQQLQLPHAQSQISPFVTISMGVSCLIPTLDLSPEILIETADLALYAAKKQGRDRIILKNVEFSYETVVK